MSPSLGHEHRHVLVSHSAIFEDLFQQKNGAADAEEHHTREAVTAAIMERNFIERLPNQDVGTLIGYARLCMGASRNIGM